MALHAPHAAWLMDLSSLSEASPNLQHRKLSLFVVHPSIVAQPPRAAESKSGNQSLPLSTQPPTLSLFLLDSTIITSNSMCLKQDVQEKTLSGQKDAVVGQTRCETQESGGVCTELGGHFPFLNGQWLLPLS